MLEELRITDLGVIEDARLELSPGFTVVTGETGAGKTMVLTGLGLLFGARAEPALVRGGRGKAVVEGRLAVGRLPEVVQRVHDAGGDLDDDALLLVRTLNAEGRSRAHVGGRAVPVATLSELGDGLLAVHGQSDQHRLLRPTVQRAALDRFAGAPVAAPRQRYDAAYRRHVEVCAELAELGDQARERAREADLLRFGLQEVGQVRPVAGEEAELAAEVARLGHAEGLRRAAEQARAALSGGDGVQVSDAQGLVAVARRALAAEEGHDPALDALGGRLAEVSYLLADVAADLASYAESVEVDPARLAAAQERQAQLAGLLRKYGADLAAVRSWAQQAERRLAELDGDDDRRGALEAEQATLRVELAGAAAELSAARGRAAAQFGEQVTAELSALAMPHARVQVSVTQRPDPDGLPVAGRPVAFGPGGVDEVELLLAAHPGAPARPLARAASGGELSRVMLAVEVVFAGADPVPTFVFDEVDAGVGGRAAVEVGRRLATLAGTAQVLVVTHLPQVAAFADHHLVVTKTQDGRVTRSGVRAVSGEDRLRELSRMLAGLEGSTAGRDHAEELLAVAAAARARRLAD